MTETSEFGKGMKTIFACFSVIVFIIILFIYLTYCIGLFLAHAEREIHNTGTDRDYHLWFNGASDHLYDLDLSKIKDASLGVRIAYWREKVIHWGHGFSKPIPTEKDFHWSVQQAKDFLREIDSTLIGVVVIQGQWE